jgi:hypothetical protein
VIKCHPFRPNVRFLASFVISGLNVNFQVQAATIRKSRIGVVALYPNVTGVPAFSLALSPVIRSFRTADVTNDKKERYRLIPLIWRCWRPDVHGSARQSADVVIMPPQWDG